MAVQTLGNPFRTGKVREQDILAWAGEWQSDSVKNYEIKKMYGFFGRDMLLYIRLIGIIIVPTGFVI